MSHASADALPTIATIREAAATLAGHVVRTPLVRAGRLGERFGVELYVKHENLQATGSFKDRGALVKLAGLGARERARGVIAMSAGNHAQAVAHHARRLGIPAVIVMPQTTPFTKVASTAALGAEIVQDGETLAESEEVARRLADERGLVFVHPYDDMAVMSGQGTIGLEILMDVPDIAAVIVPIGGGGLISGIATALGAEAPGIEIVGVEAALYPAMTARLAGREPLCGGQTLADGIAVKNVCARAVEIVRQSVSGVFLADETAIEQAIGLFLTMHKTVCEGAAAATLVPLMTDPARFAGRKVCVVASGGNIDPRMLASVVMRQMEREDRIISLRLEIDDRPGVLGRITSSIGKAGGNILEVHHGRLGLDVPARSATLDLLIEARDGVHAEAIVRALEADGNVVRRLGAPPAPGAPAAG
jgi:threonine dehydratase